MIDQRAQAYPCKGIYPYDPVIFQIDDGEKKNACHAPVQQVFQAYKKIVVGYDIPENTENIVSCRKQDSGQKGPAEKQQLLLHIAAHLT